MFRATVIASAAAAKTHGFLYQAGSSPSFFSVRPHTSPSSSSSGFWVREVSSETTTVTTTQITHAHHARQKFPAIGLPYWRTPASSSIHSPTPPSVPLTSPANPAQGVVRLQNIPNKNVPKSGAKK